MVANCLNPRQGEYYQYLIDHIGGVQKSWEQFLKPVIMKSCPEELEACERAIASHDASKYEDDEFNAYCNYFYPCEGFEKDQNAFDLAWLIHQHRNPHHWQHWVLMRDSGEKQPLDMPIPEIVNMVADWHSFSKKDPKSTAAAWYEKNKSKMLHTKFTTEWVTFFLQYLTEPLK